MVEAGCTGLQFGVESGSQEVLDRIGKGITVSQVVSAVKEGFACGLKDVACSFTIGHPYDTEETVAETFRLMETLKSMGAKLALAIVTPFPGTPIALDPQRFGVTIHDRHWDTYYLARPVISTRYLTKDEIGQLFMYAMTHIVE